MLLVNKGGSKRVSGVGTETNGSSSSSLRIAVVQIFKAIGTVLFAFR